LVFILQAIYVFTRIYALLMLVTPWGWSREMEKCQSYDTLCVQIYF